MGPSRPAFQGDSSSLEPIRIVTYDFQLVIRIVTMGLSRTASEINGDFGRKCQISRWI